MHAFTTFTLTDLVMRPTLRSTCHVLKKHHLPFSYQLWPGTVVPRRILTSSTSNAAPVDIPDVLVKPGSRHHNSLSTFLEYANKRNLNPRSTVYQGTLYEYKCAVSLLRLGFSLIRTGRRADAGIDLVGYWLFPFLREPLPVIVQCKASETSCGSAHVRELEGSFASIPLSWHRKDVLGLLVSTKEMTPGVLWAMSMSRHPMGYVKVTRDGIVEQFIWNQVACERGLQGVGVTIRHTPRVLMPDPEEWTTNGDPLGTDAAAKKHRREIARNFRKSGTRQDVQLTWLGSPVQLDSEAVKTAAMTFIASTIPKEPPDLASCKRDGRGRPVGSKDKKARAAQGQLSVCGKKLAGLSPEEQDRLRSTYLKLGRPRRSKDLKPEKIPKRKASKTSATQTRNEQLVEVEEEENVG